MEKKEKEEEERKKERKEEKKEGKERKERRMEGGWSAMAGGHRRWPETGSPSDMWRGASVVQMVKIEFWKWWFGER